jgi:lysophospholipase L1-like esterase
MGQVGSGFSRIRQEGQDGQEEMVNTRAGATAMKKALWVCRPLVAVAALMLSTGPELDGLQTQPGGARWRTAWATAQQTAGTATITNSTVRLVARVTIGGESVRIRLDNTYGKAPLTVGRAYVAQRARGAALVAGSNRKILFGGAEGATIPPGGSVRSDPVPMRVLALQDLAVSLHLPDKDVQPSQHSGALTTSYLGAPDAGDQSSVETGEPFKATMTTMPWLKAIDVLSSSAAGTIVAFGDSITDGTCATVDAHDRWVDWLAIRLALEDHRRGGRNVQKAVVNEGIGGNTVTGAGLQPPPDSTPGIERLERDVLTHEGVSDVILFMGTNDIRRGASAAQVMDGMSQIIKRVKARGMKIYGTTIIPRHNVAASGTNTGWNEAKSAIRREVNQWMRTASFDGVLDFDAVVKDPANANLIAAPFNCDGIHPTPLGYYAMGRSVSLDLFAR